METVPEFGFYRSLFCRLHHLHARFHYVRPQYHPDVQGTICASATSTLFQISPLFLHPVSYQSDFWVVHSIFFSLNPFKKIVYRIRYAESLYFLLKRYEALVRGELVALQRAYDAMKIVAADVSRLRLFHGVFTAAPQLALQLYLLINCRAPGNLCNDGWYHHKKKF